MPGTVTGGRRAAATNKKKYGDDFFRKIGSRGGQRGHTGGFASNPELAKIAGAKGGKKSRRTGVTTGAGKKREYYYTGDGVFKPVSEENDSVIEQESSTHWIKRIFGGK